MRFQPIDATHWLNCCAGVSKFNVFLGRSLSRLATAFSLACDTSVVSAAGRFSVAGVCSLWSRWGRAGFSSVARSPGFKVSGLCPFSCRFRRGVRAGGIYFSIAVPAVGFGAFPSSGFGSWSSVAAAAKLGLTIVDFPVGALVGVASIQLPVLPVSAGGVWSCAGAGIWSGAWRWNPSKNLF